MICPLPSSSAVKKLTHLSPHCSTDSDTHILGKTVHKTAHLRFWGDPSSLDNSLGFCRKACSPPAF